MFTGLIESKGRVDQVVRRGEGARITVTARWPGADHTSTGAGIGDSVAINGVCLTVVDVRAAGGDARLCFDASHETLACTSLGQLAAGTTCNLERALRIGDRLGGHFVSGHVDDRGHLERIIDRGDAQDLEYRVPSSLEAEIAAKGSVAIDGVSLTVNRVWAGHFSVTIIPHTARMTQLLDGGVGKTVNIETDVLAKYVRRVVQMGSSPTDIEGGLSASLLERSGFIDPRT